MTPETKTPTRAEALAEYEREVLVAENVLMRGLFPEWLDTKIRAALATDAPIVEGQIIATIENEIFDYCTAHHAEGWDHKSLAKHIAPLIAAYAQGRTQSAVPERWREPKLLDELAFDNGDEILVELRGCDSGKLRKAVLVWDSSFDEWRFDGSEVSNAWSITRWLPISAAPPVTGGAWLPIEDAALKQMYSALEAMIHYVQLNDTAKSASTAPNRAIDALAAYEDAVEKRLSTPPSSQTRGG